MQGHGTIAAIRTSSSEWIITTCSILLTIPSKLATCCLIYICSYWSVDSQVQGHYTITTCNIGQCMGCSAGCIQGMLVPDEWQLTWADSSCSVTVAWLIDCQVQNHCTIATSNASPTKYYSILCRLRICLACFKPYIYRLAWTRIVWTANCSINHRDDFWSYSQIQCHNNTIAASDCTLQSILIYLRLRIELIIYIPLECFTMTYCHLLWCCFYNFSNREYMLSLKNIITLIFNY